MCGVACGEMRARCKPGHAAACTVEHRVMLVVCRQHVPNGRQGTRCNKNGAPIPRIPSPFSASRARTQPHAPSLLTKPYSKARNHFLPSLFSCLLLRRCPHINAPQLKSVIDHLPIGRICGPQQFASALSASPTAPSQPVCKGGPNPARGCAQPYSLTPSVSAPVLQVRFCHMSMGTRRVSVWRIGVGHNERRVNTAFHSARNGQPLSFRRPG